MCDPRVTTASGGSLEVTIIVPVYNGATTIVACVSSLLAVHYVRARFEVIVVDNGSTDGTRDLLRAFGDNIRVLTVATRGASAARNCGIREARSPLIAFTDADCVVEPDWLCALVMPLVDPHVGVAGGRILSRVGGNRIEKFGERIHDHRRAIEVEAPPYVISMNWASRRELLLETGLFDEALLRGQDVDLAWRILQSGHRLVYVSNAIMRHHNERTIRGLVHEGYIHGRHGVRVSAKHARLWPHVRPRWKAGLALLRRDVRWLGRRQDRGDALLWLLFDSGKLVGQWLAQALAPASAASRSGARMEGVRK
jgi:glycosyltransferase involved in cell wall biosynthesis